MKEYLSNKNLVIFVLLAAVVVLILTNFKSCSGAAYDKQQALQNEQAMKKVITTEKNKNGELQHSIIAYEGKVKDLSKYSKELSEDVKALKNRKPEVIIKTKLVYVGDTSKKVKNTLKENGNGNYDLEWKCPSDLQSVVIQEVNKELSYFFNRIVVDENTDKNDQSK